MRIDHLGIAVTDLAAAGASFGRLLGTAPSPPELVESQKVRVSFLAAGESHLELLQPTEPSSTVARFIERKGEGLHHVAFAVPSVDAALAEVRAAGGRLVDERSRPGARGRRVGFAHPSAFSGSLVEFVEGP